MPPLPRPRPCPQASEVVDEMQTKAKHKELLQIPGMGSTYGRSRVALSPKKHDKVAGRVVSRSGISNSTIGECYCRDSYCRL
jgi:hypothetical protein